MGLLSVIFLACALAMDAFAVSLCKGLAVRSISARHYLIVGLYFGGFQALMPTLGYLLGGAFASFVGAIDHWIAFGLLCFVGAKMVRESFAAQEGVNSGFDTKTMLALAVATSIDALAVGVSFAFVEFSGLSIASAVVIIGILTCFICAGGLYLGHAFNKKLLNKANSALNSSQISNSHANLSSNDGVKLGKKAEFIGGAVLIILGVKILVEHLLKA